MRFSSGELTALPRAPSWINKGLWGGFEPPPSFAIGWLVATDPLCIRYFVVCCMLLMILFCYKLLCSLLAGSFYYKYY